MRRLSPQTTLVDRIAAGCHWLFRQNRGQRGAVAVRYTLAIVWAIAIAPDVAQADCNDIDSPPEVLDVQVVGSRLVRFYAWPSRHIFNIETAPYSATRDEKNLGAHCFAGQSVSGDRNDASTIQLRDPDIGANSTFRIRIFWSDQNQGSIVGKAGDIIAARCASIDLAAQKEQCDSWRRIGVGFKLSSDWPSDWR
jgi:hypothetical protein